MISPIQSAPVQRGAARLRQLDGAMQSGCNVFECGAKVIACAGVCLSGVGSAACIACLGSAYDSCKDCF